MYILAILFEANVAAVLALLGSSTLELAVLPIPVAVFFGSQRRAGAAGLVMAAIFGAYVVRFSVALAAYYGMVACLGLLIGLGARRNWTYGQIVTLCTVIAFSVACFAALVSWETWSQEGRRMFEEWISLLAASEQDSSPALEETQAQLGWLLRDHWVDVGVGLLFASTLTMVCVAVSGATWRLRNRAVTTGPVGSFREMRTPDWIVWIGIAVALLWFLDYHRPGLGLRPYVWNTATGLAAIYWLNGISVALFAATLLGTPLAYTVAVVSALLCGAYVMFFIGLFDTWIDFRRRLDKWHNTLLRLQKPDA